MPELAEGGRVQQAFARGSCHLPVQDHHRSWSSRSDFACPEDREPGCLFGAQTNDTARHAGIAAHRLTDGESHRPRLSVDLCIKAALRRIILLGPGSTFDNASRVAGEHRPANGPGVLRRSIVAR